MLFMRKTESSHVKSAHLNLIGMLRLSIISVQGESGGLRLGYVDINSVSFGGYPETELSQHNPVRDHQTHPVHVQS